MQRSYFNTKIDFTLTTDATVATYSYNALGRLISVGMPSDADFYAAYTYLADGKLYSETLANGAETRNHFYNSLGWLLRIDGDRFNEDITHVTGWIGPGYYDGRIKTTLFTYNWSGKPDDYAVQYTYDDVGQLTSADNNLNNAWDIGVTNSISYDANGNILDLTRGSITKNYAYYAVTNKVQNFDGSGNDYGYDANTNVTRSDPKTIPTITYDSFTQQPTSVSMSSGASLTLEYGGDTQRVLKNYTSGTTTNSKLYLHGGNDYPLIEKNKTSATAETLAVYIYGLNGTVAKRMGSTVLFLLKDHLGSTRVVMDATGLVRTYYDYDALGNLIRIGTVNEVKYQFTGQEYDESNLHNYRARMYDSDFGKFYAVDPAGEFASSFAYVRNNPINLVDPSGKFSFIPILFSAAYAAGNAIIDDKHVGLAAAQSAGLNLVSQGIFSVAHPAIGDYILAQGVSGGITSGIGASLNNGSFGRGFARGFIQSVAFAALSSNVRVDRGYREQDELYEKVNNFVRWRGWRVDTYVEDFAERDWGNFVNRLSLDMGHNHALLYDERVFYNPEVNGGVTKSTVGRPKLEIGNSKSNVWFESIANARSVLEHEWIHVKMDWISGIPHYFGPDNPKYAHEIIATLYQVSSPAFLFTTPAFKNLTYDYLELWSMPFFYPSTFLVPGTSDYNFFVYGK